MANQETGYSHHGVSTAVLPRREEIPLNKESEKDGVLEIFVLEDDPELNFLIGIVLASKYNGKARIRSFTSLESFSEEIKEKKCIDPCLLSTDLNLNGDRYGGLIAIEMFKQNTDKSKVVVLSATTEDVRERYKTEEDKQRVGLVGILDKPFSVDNYLEIVETGRLQLLNGNEFKKAS